MSNRLVEYWYVNALRVDPKTGKITSMLTTDATGVFDRAESGYYQLQVGNYYTQVQLMHRVGGTITVEKEARS